MGRHSVGHSYNNETDRKNAQPSHNVATFCRSLDCAGPLADGPNRQNALDICIYTRILLPLLPKV